MTRRIRQRLTYGNVVGTLALFIALGGTSYAAITITSKNVRNNTLTGADVRNNSLTGGDIKDKSLTAKDFAGTLPSGTPGLAGPRGLTGATGPAGAAGAAGAKGDKGDKGDAGDIFTVSTLPSGETLRGSWNGGGNASAGGEYLYGGISYPVPLADNVELRVIQSADTPPAECPGTFSDPDAASGYLCVFEGSGTNNAGTIFAYATVNGLGDFRYGAAVYFTSSGAGNAEAWGTWAVTAP